MKKNRLQKNLLFFSLLGLVLHSYAGNTTEPMATGMYQASWESLRQYNEAPDWYKDAKFGIWAHWGPQCQPEDGDWYARFMYFSGTSQYNYHVSKYGSPSTFGFKDVINSWKAESWSPDSLVHLYKNAGAQYFFAMANHHDNFDMFDSKYQTWNSVAIGPKKDIIGGWSAAAKKYGLPFGVSVHASHAWTWLEPSQDWDGKLTTADGKGKWWEGLDPQELYAQNHTRSTGSTSSGTIHSQWNWTNGASIPDSNYLNKFYNRTVDLINKYNPDLLYFDDTALPFDGISNVGLRIAAHMYNKSMSDHQGKNEAVIFGKILTDSQKEAIVWDVERGIPDRIQAKYWQTCTCIGDWHYNINVYNNNGYKSAQTVIRMLIDIVSKNGNLLLNIPVKGNGTIDNKELTVVNGIKSWMDINKNSIYKTRPWIVFGEGPTADAVNPLSAQGFNEGVSYSNKDVRYACRKDTVFATIMGWPDKNEITLKALGSASSQYLGTISKVTLLGYGALNFSRSYKGLRISFPATAIPTGSVASVLRIEFDSTLYSFPGLTTLISQSQQAADSAALYKGLNTGQYNADSIDSFQSAIELAKQTTSNSGDSVIRAAILALQYRFNLFVTNAQVKGGILTFPKTQNITRYALKESRNFSRTDQGTLGTGRWGLLAEPWQVSNNLLNQESFTRGGFDNYSNSQSIGIQKWNASDPAITNGWIYQSTTLPAGTYKLKIKVHENWGLQAGEDYLTVCKGKGLPLTAEVPAKSMAYYDMSSSTSGGQFTVCTFKLDTVTEVSIGWATTIAASATSRSMRVNEILLLDANNLDISSLYLKNYTSIKRKDMSFKRFGTPANWTAENFNIPQSNSDGTKSGIDRYSGYKALMMGVWDDAGSATGNIRDAKIYRKITLPAGQYSFTAGYDAVYHLTNMNLFVAETLPTLSTLSTTALTSYSILSNTNDGVKYGLQFNLPKTTEITLGWIGSLADAAEQEFRVKEVTLNRILTNDEDKISDAVYDAQKAGDYTLDMNTFDALTNLTWSSTLENINYITGNTAGSIEVGEFNFGDSQTQLFTIEAASNKTVSEGQGFQLFSDNETQPFAFIAAKNTGGNLYFEPLKSGLCKLTGTHKVYIRYANTDSNIKSFGFTVKSTVDAISNTQNNKAYQILTNKHNITIYNLKKETIAIYNVNGTLLQQRIANHNAEEFTLESGMYLIRIGNTVQKIVTTE